MTSKPKGGARPGAGRPRTRPEPHAEKRPRGRPSTVEPGALLVPLPVRVTPEAAAIAKAQGGAWVSALIVGAE